VLRVHDSMACPNSLLSTAPSQGQAAGVIPRHGVHSTQSCCGGKHRWLPACTRRVLHPHDSSLLHTRATTRGWHT
jgi:hypothetical protein